MIYFLFHIEIEGKGGWIIGGGGGGAKGMLAPTLKLLDGLTPLAPPLFLRLCTAHLLLALETLALCESTMLFALEGPGRVAQSVGRLTRKSGVLGSIPGLATYFRFSFRFFKKGSCHLLAKVCA